MQCRRLGGARGAPASARDAPKAFATTLEKRQPSPEDVWRQRAQGGPGLRASASVKTGPRSAWPPSSPSPPLGACSLSGCGWTGIIAVAALSRSLLKMPGPVTGAVVLPAREAARSTVVDGSDRVAARPVHRPALGTGQASIQTPSQWARPSASSRRRLTAATRSDHHRSLRSIPR